MRYRVSPQSRRRFLKINPSSIFDGKGSKIFFKHTIVDHERTPTSIDAISGAYTRTHITLCNLHSCLTSFNVLKYACIRHAFSLQHCPGYPLCRYNTYYLSTNLFTFCKMFRDIFVDRPAHNAALSRRVLNRIIILAGGRVFRHRHCTINIIIIIVLLALWLSINHGRGKRRLLCRGTFCDVYCVRRRQKSLAAGKKANFSNKIGLDR